MQVAFEGFPSRKQHSETCAEVLKFEEKLFYVSYEQSYAYDDHVEWFLLLTRKSEFFEDIYFFSKK
jgi:hypothetical protein